MAGKANAFGALLVETMKAEGATVTETAHRSGVSERTIRYYRRGQWHNKRDAPNPVKIAGLALAFNQNPYEWCEKAGAALSPIELDIARRTVGRVATDATLISRMADLPVTIEDLEYLIGIQRGLRRPLSLGLMAELIWRRAPPEREGG